MSIAGRDYFLKPFERRFKLVDLPGGQSARIRNLTEGERIKLIDSRMRNKAGDVTPERLLRHRRLWIIACLIDDAGNQLFSDADMVQLESMDAGVLGLLSDEAIRHSGVGDFDAEDHAKNSEPTPACDSPSS